MNERPVEVSVVIPVYNEVDNVAPLAAEVHQALAPRPESYELIYVDDGSSDGTVEACLAVDGVRLVRHPRNLGQSAATVAGIERARGELIATLDGDRQNDPASIPDLLDALAAGDGADVAVGVRQGRQDTLSRKAASRVAYLVRNLFLADRIVDVGCSLRVFPRREGLALPRFDGLHRLMPAVLSFRGLRVAQVPTRHRARVAGASKYGNVKRGLRGLFDLLGLYWLKRRLLRASASVGVVEVSGPPVAAAESRSAPPVPEPRA